MMFKWVFKWVYGTKTERTSELWISWVSFSSTRFAHLLESRNFDLDI